MSSVHSDRAPAPVGAYPHARKVGQLLFLSGIGPRVPGTNEVPGNVVDGEGRVVQHDIERQARQVFANIKTILEDAGSSWDRIVDVTVFLTNMQHDFPIFNRIYAEYFTANQPTRTTVEINALPTPIAVELKVIATV
jgi:2-aminomuconate deaminase